MDISIHQVTSIVTSKSERKELRGKPYWVTDVEFHTVSGEKVTVTSFSDVKIGMLGAVYGAPVKAGAV